MTRQAFDPELAVGAGAVLEHLNGNHADTVLFLARHVAAAPGADDAELLRADPTGLELSIRDGGAPRSTRIAFDRIVSSVPELQGAVAGLLAAARSASPGTPLTSMEQELASHASIPTHVATVTCVSDLRPRLREITLGGLDHFEPLGGDEFVLVIVPQPGHGHQLHGAPSFTALKALPDDERPAMAYYTVRRWWPKTHELTAWFVLHDHNGPVSGWARSAAPGDRVALWGPRRAYHPPADTEAVFLVGDETALAAIARVMDQSDADVPMTVVAEVAGPAAEIELPSSGRASVRWVHRGDAEPGSTDVLLDAVAALDLPERAFVFGAAESRRISAVRRYLREQQGLLANRVHLTGYWRRARS